MSRMANYIAAAAAILGVFGSSIAPASAACKKMGFLVNDYGKDGPTSDAQMLLDKHIAAWADKEGIEEYSVGKKTVKCELFLDFIVFDEHTCTASATVCWGGSKQPKVRDAKAKKKSKTTTAKAKTESKAKKTVAKTTPKKSDVVKTVETKKEDDKPAKSDTVETSALPKKAVEAEKAEASSSAPSSSPTVPYANDAKIRNAGDGATDTAKVTEPTSDSKTTDPKESVASERAAADRAAAAAERAAAAAERAAAAAQLAAEAAKQAAAAGQDNSSSAVVAPVEPVKSP